MVDLVGAVVPPFGGSGVAPWPMCPAAPDSYVRSMRTGDFERPGPERLQPFRSWRLVVLALVPLLVVVGLVLGTTVVDSRDVGTSGATTLPSTSTAAPTGPSVEAEREARAAEAEASGWPKASEPPAADTTVPSDAPTAPTSGPEASTDATDASSDGLPPQVDAAAYVVVDGDGEVLAELAADESRAMGSITKLMTARVVMEAGNLDDTAGVLELDPASDESRIGLEPGTLYRRDVLLRAMLIVSASDAAHALAVDVAGSEEAFVERMNDEAADLGLDGTHFVSPVGLDDPDHYSTARDIAELSLLLMQDESFRSIVSRRDATLHGRTLPATNDLLGTYPGADGVKTGHTDDAGWCLAASALRDGERVFAVVLGSSTADGRTASATTLLDWAFAH